LVWSYKFLSYDDPFIIAAARKIDALLSVALRKNVYVKSYVARRIFQKSANSIFDFRITIIRYRNEH